MSRLFFISCYVFGLFSFAFSQTVDTSYFNKSWKPCNKEKAKFYRLVHKVDEVYNIQDFYKTGVLQMKASAISIEPEVFDGEVTYYHANGKIQSIGIYNKGQRNGVWKYYDAKGRAIGEDNYGMALTRDKAALDSNNIPKKAYKKAISETDNKFSFALRGKLFGFFIIEDTYFSTATLGTELLFKGRHSLGVDYTYFGWQYEHDDTKDVALYETYERRGYVYFDYKYKFLAYKKFDFYINLYDKIGTYHMWHEGVAEGYNFWEKPFLTEKVDGTFNQLGAGLGFKKYYNEQFYIDISANGGKVFSKNNSILYDENMNIADAQYNVKTDENVFYIRINFGYKLFVNKKKEEEVFYTN